MHAMLARGHSALVCPGGMRECLYMEHGREAVYLTKRTGFVRIALQHGDLRQHSRLQGPSCGTPKLGNPSIYGAWSLAARLSTCPKRMRFVRIELQHAALH